MAFELSGEPCTIANGIVRGALTHLFHVTEADTALSRLPPVLLWPPGDRVPIQNPSRGGGAATAGGGRAGGAREGREKVAQHSKEAYWRVRLAATEAWHVRRDEQPWRGLVERRGLRGLKVLVLEVLVLEVLVLGVLCVQLVSRSGSPGLEVGWVEAVVGSSDILAQALVGRVREELQHRKWQQSSFFFVFLLNFIKGASNFAVFLL